MRIRAEFRKLWTARSTWLLLGVAAAVVAAGVSGAMARRNDPAAPEAQQAAIAHVGLVALFSLLLGIMVVAGEYRHRTITDTFLAVPRRGRVVAAKAVVSAVAGAVFGAVASACALATDAIWLAARGWTFDPGSAELWDTVLGGVGWNIVFAVLGVGVGAVVTNLNAAVAAALAWLALVEVVVGQLLGGAGRWLPFALGEALVGLPADGDRPAAWAAGLALAGYAALFLTAGLTTTVRRDVT